MAKPKKSALGRGLNALIPTVDDFFSEENEKNAAIEEIAINQLFANPNQPRKNFDEDQLQDLVDSIKEHGLLQPIIVVQRDDRYMIVAGERRWRAAQKADIPAIPAIVKTFSDKEILEIALIENIQRADLNPVEEAQGYQALMEQFSYTAEDLAKRMGKSRPKIVNSLRLLALPKEVLDMLADGRLTIGHARPLLTLGDAQWQIDLAQEIDQNGMSVRQVEALINEIKADKPEKRHRGKNKVSPYPMIAEQLKEWLGTKVKIKEEGKKGKIEIEFYGEQDLKRILDALGGKYY